MRSVRKDKRGTLTIYITAMIVMFVIVLVAAVLAPMGVLFNTEAFAAGEMIYGEANESVLNIENDEVRESIQNMINASFDAQENNIEVNNNIFRYSWIFAIAITALVLFLMARALVEFRTGGGFV